MRTIKYTNQVSLVFPSRSANESFARSAAAAFAAQLDPTLDELGDVKTAVSEAVTNVCVHAYSNKSDGIMQIECKVDEKERSIEVVVRDFGKGIDDVTEAIEPFFTTAEDDERSGMGFTIMQTFMDEMQVSSQVGKGTVVTMKKVMKQC